jgi:hypothetical protein
MSDNGNAADRDPELVDRLTELVRATAYMICGEQPGVPQPRNLRDLDSFSIVQVLLELEKSTSVLMLEELEDFQGETFGELADDIVRIAERDGALAKLVESVPDRGRGGRT